MEATRSSLGLGLALVPGQGGTETCEGEVELFISRPGHATGYHFDFQVNHLDSFAVNLLDKVGMILHASLCR